jgi:hypothetical protein
LLPVRQFSDIRVNPRIATMVRTRWHDDSCTRQSGVCETRLVGPSGAVARLGVVRGVRDSSGVRPRLRALGMNRPSVRGDAGLAPAVGLIRRLSAVSA